MTKTMYSLILTDEVIERIDRLAYEKGMSRSQMVDHLLAREVGLSTPEQQTRLIVRHAADRMSENVPSLQLHIRSDLGSMEIATFVKFKYNPSIKYSFDILASDGRHLCVLKINSRSTSAELRTHLDSFLQLLSAIDRRYMCSFLLPADPKASSGRFQRPVYLPRLFEETEDPEEIAERLSNYIVLIDDTMQSYFASLWSPSLQEDVESAYLKHLIP